MTRMTACIHRGQSQAFRRPVRSSCRSSSLCVPLRASAEDDRHHLRAGDSTLRQRRTRSDILFRSRQFCSSSKLSPRSHGRCQQRELALLQIDGVVRFLFKRPTWPRKTTAKPQKDIIVFIGRFSPENEVFGLASAGAGATTSPSERVCYFTAARSSRSSIPSMSQAWKPNRSRRDLDATSHRSRRYQASLCPNGRAKRYFQGCLPQPPFSAWASPSTESTPAKLPSRREKHSSGLTRKSKVLPERLFVLRPMGRDAPSRSQATGSFSALLSCRSRID